MADDTHMAVALAELKGMLATLTERVDGYHTDLTNRIDSGDRQNAQTAEFLKSQLIDVERRTTRLELDAGAYAPGAARIQEIAAAVTEISKRIEKVDLLESRVSNIEQSRAFTFRTTLTSVVLPLVTAITTATVLFALNLHR